MIPEVRDRIDQLRHGNVPGGYKKTGSGIIPNEWQVGQVSECIEEYKLLSNDIEHIPVYSSSRKGLIPQSDYYDQREAVETNLGYKVVPQGYVTYRHMSDDDVFHFNINRTGGDILVSSEYPVFTSSDNCDLSFLIPALNNTARFRYFCKIQKLGGTRTRLYLDNLKKYALALPPFNEQIKIAEILTTQDKVIELQERKIEELKRFKKGCLERMFPRKGQKVPEKRFHAFTNDWEQRKLGDIMNVTSVKRIHQSDWTDSGIRFLRARDIVSASKNEEPDDYLYISKEKYDEYSLVSGKVAIGDLLVTGVGTIGVPYLIRNSEPLYFKDGNIIWFQNGTKIDGDFFLYSFFGKAIQDFINESAGIGTVGTYTIESGKKTPISLPEMKEQQQIGAYFRNLDNLITLHQRKLEEMKIQKKALMQLLLTGIVRVKGE